MSRTKKSVDMGLTGERERCKKVDMARDLQELRGQGRAIVSDAPVVDDALLSVEEAARRLGGLSKYTIHAWLAKGKLTSDESGQPHHAP